MTPLAPHLTAFLRERLPVQRRASQHTCDTYAYAFQLLLSFASQRLGKPPSLLSIEEFDVALISDFLVHLQTARRNEPRTRNARLAAIKSFMHFLEHRNPFSPGADPPRARDPLAALRQEARAAPDGR